MRIAAIILIVAIFNTLFSQSNITDTTHLLKGVVIKSGAIQMEQQAVKQLSIIGESDLKKSACCNLSESFENSATVDVTFADAVSGAKQLKMLGLEGIYAQNLTENLVGIRGLNQTFGTAYVPGPWLKSIQLSKGVGSVTNGFESITGQINAEFKKPQNAEKFFVNFYINQDARTEFVLYHAHHLKNPKWSVANFGHAQINWLKRDMNHDHFMDNPLVNQFNFLNRWNYFSGNRFAFNSSIFFTYEDRTGGSIYFDRKTDDISPVRNWGIFLKTIRTEAFAKASYVLSDKASALLQGKYYYHQQDGQIGLKNYAAREHFGFVNLHFQQEFAEHDNKLKLGISLQLNDTKENIDSFHFSRKEIIPGIYGEYSQTYFEKLFLVYGFRVDHHNLYGTFLTPRIHLRYHILHALNLRASAGRGYRVPNVVADNFGSFANNRQLVLPKNIKAEVAWNYGGSLRYDFNLNFYDGSISVDFYRTHFENQLVIDLENPFLLQMYNLNGKSYANSMQIEAEYEIIKNLTTKIAYKFDDVHTTYHNTLKRKPLKPLHKGLFTINYKTKNEKWRFDMGLVWYGKSRIPANAATDFEESKSKDLFLLNAQVTFVLKKVWEFYIGGENLANQQQKNPIINSQNPFSNTFDASLIWGTTRGAMAFAGIRFKIE